MRIKFPIGDWSGDGHEKCDWYIIETAKEIILEEVREAHFKAKEVLGFDIGNICSDYAEDTLSIDQLAKLKELNYECVSNENDLLNNEDWSLQSLDVIKIWLFLLNHINPSLELKLIEENIPIINFYGYDEKQRHLSNPGYGCFDI